MTARTVVRTSSSESLTEMTVLTEAGATFEDKRCVLKRLANLLESRSASSLPVKPIKAVIEMTSDKRERNAVSVLARRWGRNSTNLPKSETFSRARSVDRKRSNSSNHLFRSNWLAAPQTRTTSLPLSPVDASKFRSPSSKSRSSRYTRTSSRSVAPW